MVKQYLSGKTHPPTTEMGQAAATPTIKRKTIKDAKDGANAQAMVNRVKIPNATTMTYFRP
jgi:hypothetical protein